MVAYAAPASGVVYRRRQPEQTILYQAVAKHWPTFVATTDEAERSVPKFVRREFDGFLDCGIIEKGAVRVRCPSCGFDRLVAFSCKSRSGLCQSCAARRMVDIATHLCDHVITDVPLRQWVITVPHPVRYLLAYDAALLARVTNIFVHAVLAHLRLVARRELAVQKGARIESGAICVPQRFNSALGLAPHLHALVADGVWVQIKSDEPPSFHALPKPTKEEITAVAWSTCQRIVKLLEKRGLWLEADTNNDRLAQEQPLLAALAGASIAGVLAMGPSAGKRPVRLFGQAARETNESCHKPQKNAYGFDLHANTRAAAGDKKARERLCRYLLRPPLSNDRLTLTDDGKYRVALKRAWDDGTCAVVFSGDELMARLAVLVPPPRVHTTRYFGVWAPRSKMRRLVVPDSPAPTKIVVANEDGERDVLHHRYRLSWAQALSKVFAIDIMQCPRCNQKGMQQIATIQDARVLRAILASIENRVEPP